MKYLDVRGALFIYPALALVSYGAMTAAATLTVVELGKISENSLDYSVYNTIEPGPLRLLATREEKMHVAKQAVDTFVVRAGDLLSGVVVYFGSEILKKETSLHHAAQRRPPAGGWLFIAYAAGKENRRRTARWEGEARGQARRSLSRHAAVPVVDDRRRGGVGDARRRLEREHRLDPRRVDIRANRHRLSPTELGHLDTLVHVGRSERRAHVVLEDGDDGRAPRPARDLDAANDEAALEEAKRRQTFRPRP